MFSISGLYKRTGVILIAALLMAAIALLYFANRSPAIPQRMLRIGFEQNPPLQFHTADGLAGLGVETVVKLPNARDCGFSGSRPAQLRKRRSEGAG